jgi:superfamily II DNA or RNA helicase
MITADCYTIDENILGEISQTYTDMRASSQNELTNIIKMRQLIEFHKIPIIYDLLEKYLELNKSVAIFVNFQKTFIELIKLLTENNLDFASIYGGQQASSRESDIAKFQTNQTRIIICMIQAGGQSISLHDTNGTHPRVSLISPSYSSIELIQTLGRIYRANVKTPVQQKIIFCADTYEINICTRLKAKINYLNTVSDDDFACF